MGAAGRKEILTSEDYLMLERQSSEKSEFYQGECFAMAGASRRHNMLAGRIFAALLRHLDGKFCFPYMSDMRLDITSHNHYVYPDVFVVCDESAYIADDMVNDALVIIEVLSPTTESYDRGKKFLHYQSLDSFAEYVLISQSNIQVEVFRRNDAKKWEYEILTEPSDILHLNALEFSIPISELYK
ncbi:MAG: hypothetical protein BWK80_36565 [Desulfobacteraceae bacterium IS3]|nr:MAG: hypothetical protein BWK80_36565 [Desulfobacteraceae bacterium IS3]